MVHRDIKPHESGACSDGKKHTVKILDFGLAKATSEKKLGGDLDRATARCSAPPITWRRSRFRRSPRRIRADIYSLG